MQTACDDELWTFANRIYAAPGVSEACLRLQDEYSVDVCVLIFLLWLARERRALRSTEVRIILRTCSVWRESVVHALRTVRRELKTPPPKSATAEECESLRNMVKAAELKAERLQLQSLASLFGETRVCETAADGVAAARASMRSYATALQVTFPSEVVQSLLTGFERICPHD